MKNKLIFLKRQVLLAWILNLMILRFWNRSLRIISDSIFHFYKIKLAALKSKIPTISADSLITASEPVMLYQAQEGDGGISIKELWTMLMITVTNKPVSIFEFGTFEGRTTINLSINCPKETTIYTIDLPREKISETRYKLLDIEKHYADKPASGTKICEVKTGGKIVQLYGDSAVFDFKPYENTIDLVFIDGSHSYKYVINDSLKAYIMLRTNGIIIWHDHATGLWNEVDSAIDHLFMNDERFTGIRHIQDTSFAILRKQ